VEWQASRPRSARWSRCAASLLRRVAGLVREIGFDSGAFVRRDDTLVKLDTSVEEAQLASAKADADLAKTSLARARALRAAGSNTPADLDRPRRARGQRPPNVATPQAYHRQEDHPGSLRGPAVDPAGRAGAGDGFGDTHRLLAVDRSHPCGVLAAQQTLAELKIGMKARLADRRVSAGFLGRGPDHINSEVDVRPATFRVRATVRTRTDACAQACSPTWSCSRRREAVGAGDPRHRRALRALRRTRSFALEENATRRQSHPDRHQKFVRLGERRGDLVAVVNAWPRERRS